MLNRVMPKDNIGLAALLKTKEAAWDNGKQSRIWHALQYILFVWFSTKNLNTGFFVFRSGLPSDVSQIHQPILVCTAHIHWDPEYCDVKLIQIMMLSHEIRQILEEASQNFRPGHKPDISNVQLLFCGDFNSLPESGNLRSSYNKLRSASRFGYSRLHVAHVPVGLHDTYTVYDF